MRSLRHAKTVTLPELLPELAGLRQKQQLIVFTNGCFDILHPGHVELLAKAKAMGDILVLGLNSDGSVARQGKGRGRPYNAYASRAFVLAHLASVDYVVGFDADTPYDLIEAVKPDILVKGGDYDLDAVVGKDIVEAYGGSVRLIPFLSGFSTTSLVKRILAAAGQEV